MSEGAYYCGMTGWRGVTPRGGAVTLEHGRPKGGFNEQGGPGRREEILGLIRESPGICAQELCTRTGLTRTALVHHVRRLVREGQVSRVRQGRRVGHFAPSVAQPVLRSLLGLVRIASVKRVLRELLVDPAVSRRALARRTGHTPHTARWHLRRLEELGILAISGSESGQSVVQFHPDLEPHLSILLAL